MEEQEKQKDELLEQPQEKPQVPEKPRRTKLKPISKLIIYLLIIFVMLMIFFGADVITSGENLSKTLGNTSLWGQIKHLIGSDDKKLKGEEEDRINILLLGMGGSGHDGPYLTDTNIIASIKPSTKEVALISVPRDLSVQIPDYGWQKINYANSIGEGREQGSGGELAKRVVSQTFNIPIHYYIRLDFAGFKQIVDDLGGITVDVENTLDDPQYPIPGKENATTTERYEHLYVEKGKTHMDGDLALKFVRSRHGLHGEGSDFARSRRQQLVLQAIKEKALSVSTIVNPIKVSNAMDTVSEHLATDLEIWEMIKLFNMGKNIKEENITRQVFTDGPDGLLYGTILDNGAFVLLPKSGNFSEMQLITEYVFEPEKIEEVKPKIIEIHNGTKINGLAYKTSEYLQSLGYQISRIKNAPTQDYQKTVVYNLNKNPDDQTALKIAELMDVELAPLVPDWVTATSSNEVSPDATILIILGPDQN